MGFEDYGIEEGFELGGLEEVSGGLSDVGGDSSTRARDAANIAGQDMMSMGMGFGNEPQSLSEVATQGMGEGLSAMKEGLGTEGGGIELSAALEDEEEDEPIHAALEDEEEEAPIRAGRSDDEPVKANYGSSSSNRGGAPLSMNKGGAGAFNYDNNLASDSRQNIDDIFIAGSFNRGSGSSGGTSSTGGTMYDPSKDKADVHVSFGMPPIIKNLLVFIVFVAIVLAVMKYGLHIHVENYYHPVDVQMYVNEPNGTELGEKLNLKFKSATEKYSSSDFDYSYEIEQAGGLRLVNVDKKRLFIEVKGARIDYAIYGIRPQVSQYKDIVPLLAQQGFTETESYKNIEELGSRGTEYVFVNNKTGEGIIIGKKESSQSIKSVKYVENYKRFKKVWDAIRNNA